MEDGVASGATLMAGGSWGMGPPALLVDFLAAPAAWGGSSLGGFE